MNIRVKTFNELPPNTRRGGAGRRSKLLDAVREALDAPGKMVEIDLKENNLINEGENIEGALSRNASRFYRRGALDFPREIRTDPEAGVLRIFRMKDETPQGVTFESSKPSKYANGNGKTT
jgi:hypothetical protein